MKADSHRYSEITKEVIGCSFEVINELGNGFLEKVYENALLLTIKSRGLIAEKQVPINVYYRDSIVGEYFADILVEKKVIIELKVSNGIAPEHQAQLINYLKATRIEVGLLINFGKPQLEFKRVYYTSKKQ